MRFTIAIPTYNNVNTIEKSIKSAINQIYKEDFEILVVDNCCSDGTDKLLESYKEKITIIRNDTTVSLYKNHNICLEHAKGDYIFFCHSDDYLLPDALSKINNILSKRNFPTKYVVWGRSNFRDYFLHLQRNKISLDTKISGKKSIRTFLHGGLTPSGTCYSVKSFRKIGGFLDTDHKLSPTDLTSMWKLSLNGFEFEMSSHMLFWREYASTAINLTRDIQVESTKVVLESFLETISFEEKRMFLNQIKEVELIESYSLTLALISCNIENKKKIFWKLFLKCFSHPNKFINSNSLFIFKELLKMYLKRDKTYI